MSIFLSSVAISLQHLRIKFSYHNSYFIHVPEIVGTFLYRAGLLEQGYIVTIYKSALQKFYGRHHELVGRYSISMCAPWEPICSPCQDFSYFAFFDFLWATRWALLDKQQSLPYFSQFLVESELLIYFNFFIHVILVVSCFLLCVFFFCLVFVKIKIGQH